METKQAYSASDVILGKAPYKCGDTLINHTSEETAYIVSDYPYGKLRCLMRVWIETRSNMGQRSMMQTQNPKSMRWNKPKASTYTDILCLTFDNEGHIEQHGFSMAYSDEGKAQAFLDRFGSVLDPLNVGKLKLKIDYSIAMDQAKAKSANPLEYGTKEYWEAHHASMKSAMLSSGIIAMAKDENPKTINGNPKIVIPNEVKPNTEIEF